MDIKTKWKREGLESALKQVIWALATLKLSAKQRREYEAFKADTEKQLAALA